MTLQQERLATAAEAAVRDHLDGLRSVLDGLAAEEARLARWGARLAAVLAAGGRALVAGNGGSAAEAQHFAAELVGRFDRERRPYSALALNTDSSSVTAIGNDYGFEEVFARQVRAHARPGDILLLLSTSGRSPNLLRAAEAAREAGAASWCLTGPGPNPLAAACDDALALAGASANVQEAQLAAVHALCVATEHELERLGPGTEAGS